MRRRLLASTLTIVVAILILFGVPLAIVLDHTVHADAQSHLQREAVHVAGEIALKSRGGRHMSSADLDHEVPAGDRVVVHYPNGLLVANSTKLSEAIAVEVTASDGAKVRVSSPSDTIDARVERALLALVVLGIAALAAAIVLALVQARRLADPLARLARSATRLGEGDFSLSTPRSGVPEIDEIASSLDSGVQRIEALLRAERSFSEHASHQLRTALTGLQLRIEELASSADPAVREEADAALEQCARLLSVIEELLALARTGRTGSVSRFDLGALARQHVGDIEPLLRRAGRRAMVVAPDPVPVLATLGAVGQVLDILLSNAVRHGAGCVTVTVTADSRHARVDVADEGPGITNGHDPALLFSERSDGSGHGIGLTLARTLVTTEGGSLSLASDAPPTFRLELPLG